MTNTLSTEDLEQRLRVALSTVAETVTVDSVAPAAPPRHPRRSRRKWRIGMGIGAVAVPVTFVAAMVVHDGPEYVHAIPPEDVILTGSVDGSRYLLIETRRTDRCGNPLTGVELVEERENLIGSEWNTIGSSYGEPNDCGGRTATPRYLSDPALYDDGGTTVGDSFVWLWAVHPDVTAVRVTADDFTEDLPVHTVDGAGYVLFEVPQDLAAYTAELLVGDQVVPGSAEEQTVPMP